MAFSEALRLLITADTAGAVRGIQQVGRTADRELSRSQQTMDKWGNKLTTIGAGMIALGAVGVAGMAKAAMASEEANLAVVKLENTLANMPELAGENSQQFIDLADSIQGVTAADADAIVEAEALLGTFNLTAREIQNITPLVVDYARKFGVDIPSAAIQVGKALDGQIGALKRNGVSIDEVLFKTDRYAAVQQALTDQVGGFAKAEGETFAGSLQRLKNEMGDLAEGVGVGAVDAFESMFGVVEGVTDRFGELSPATQSLVGQIATFGSVGLIAAGGLSLMVGQAIKMHQNFSILASGVSGLTTKMGGLKGVLTGGAGLAGAFVLAGVVLDQYNDKQAEAERLAQTYADALSKTGDAQRAALDEITATDKSLDRIRRTLREADSDVDVFQQAIESNNDELADMRDIMARTPPIQHLLEDAFREAADGGSELAAELLKVIRNGDAYGNSTRDLLGDLENQRTGFREGKEIILDAAHANEDAKSDVDALGSALEDQAVDVEEATSALEDYVSQLAAMTDPVFAAMDAITGVRDAQVGLADAERGVLEAQVALDEAIREHGRNSDEAAEAALGLEDAQRGLSDAQWATVESAAEADSALAGLKDAVDNGDVSMGTFQETLAQWVAQGFLTEQQAARAAMEVAGLAGEAEEADKERVEVPVSTPGSVPSREQLRLTREAAFAIPPTRSVAVSATGYSSVSSLVDRINRKMAELHDKDLTIRTHFVSSGQGGSGGIPLEARGHGGPVGAGRLYEVAEQGRAELLEMGGRTYLIPGADGTVIPAGSMAGGGGGAGTVINVTVNVDRPFGSPSEIGGRVVEAIRAFERGNGPGWRN